MLKITMPWMNSWMMSNPTTKIGIYYFTRIHDALTIAKVQMLNKPYIHYIDVKVMNSVSRKSLD
jgi:hypothetical protein